MTEAWGDRQRKKSHISIELLEFRQRFKLFERTIFSLSYNVTAMLISVFKAYGHPSKSSSFEVN